LGSGDWGWGIGHSPHPPIPNPQSPIPNPQKEFIKDNIDNDLLININNKYKIIYKI